MGFSKSDYLAPKKTNSVTGWGNMLLSVISLIVSGSLTTRRSRAAALLVCVCVRVYVWWPSCLVLSFVYTRTHTHEHALVLARSHILVKLAKPQKINLTVYAQNEKNTLFRWLHLPFTVSLHFGYGFGLVLSDKTTTPTKRASTRV